MSPILFLVACDGLDARNKDAVEQGDEVPPGGSLCPEDLDVFVEHVWEPVLSKDCAVCHAPGGIGSSSAFNLFPDDLQASMEATFVVADRLVAKPTNTHPDGHGGGAVVAVGSQNYEALTFWAGWIQGTCDVPVTVACDAQESERLLRRLTHTEYARTIGDLLGIEVDPASFASDPVVEGFRNDAHALVVGDLLADQYRTNAEQIGEDVDVASLVPCAVGAGDATCAAAFIEDWGFTAFRRPLTQPDIDRYLTLWTEVAAVEGFESGIRWVITAMIQSPNVIYRSELGVQGEPGKFTLTGWEVATALSYGLWGTTPDADLLARAGAGELETSAAIATVAAEMLSDPRTLETAADLVEVWFDLGPLDNVSRDGLTPELRVAMRQETRDLVIDVAASGGTLADLMTARKTYLTPELAAHYGLSGSGEVTLDGVRYGGILTQGSVLTTHGHPTGSGPVQRGVMLRERILCEELPPPPSNLDVSPPEVDPTLSTRDQFTEHSANPECASCHVKIDPLGFAFEHYDQLGRYRDDDNGHPIDDSGAVDDVPIVGPFQLADALVDDARFRSCFVDAWRRHVTGVESCGDDPGADVGLLTPLAEIPRLPSFQVRGGSPDEGDSLAVGDRVDPADPGDVELPEGGVVFDFTVNNDWGSGACWDGVVTNTSSEAVTWEVRAGVDGTVNNIWNALVAVDGADWVFTGVDFNATLDPGAQASFGLCADR